MAESNILIYTTYRVFAKIAFNVLADIKGKDYVLDGAFDKLRNWMLGGDDPDYEGFLPKLESMPNVDKILLDPNHWCVLMNFKEDLIATVGIYNVYKRSMLLAKNKGMDFPFVDGMICDWKNNKEYRMIDYITQMIEQQNDLN